MTRYQPTPKINKAFNKLMDFNILAKKDWACCQTCGHYEMDEYLNTFNKHYRIGSLKLKNYLFFHDQDRDYLDSDGSTYLAYDLDEEAKKTVMQVFKDHGLNPEWDGNQNKRIKITERKIINGVGKEEKTKRGIKSR